VNVKLEEHFEEAPPRDELEAFFEILRSYNREQVGTWRYKKLILLLKDDDGKVKGGLEAHTYFDWMFIENLAVDASVRKGGWGTKLMEAAHEEARRRGCHHAWLDTFSFQALPFYEKLGYTTFGTLDDFPERHKRYFLSRKL
jgi:GNAT superfamily N-acetyltransferase